MVNFWKFFLENRAFTYFLVVLTLISGVYAIINLPRESTPEITLPIAIINTSFFGASASDVETLVTDKIEAAIDNLSEVDNYTSTSQAGISTVVVTFEQSADIDERVTRLKEKVDSAKGQLPNDGDEPIVTKIEFSDQPIMSISLVSDLPFYTFEQVVNELEDELMKINGVASVSYAGIPEREISAIVDNRQLVEKNLDFNSITQAVSSSNNTLPAGSITIGTVEYPLDILSEVSTFEELRTMPVALVGTSPLVLGDIAQLYNGYREADTITQVGFPGSDVQNGVTINIKKKNGGDITRLAADILATFESLEESTLIGVDYIVTMDAGADIWDELFGLTKNGAMTVTLVFIILLLTVGFRESIIAAAAIPFSFMMAFVAFLVVGNTINFISLFALILSIGILVDSAIVVVEGINDKVAHGLRRQEAAIATVREFGLPLIAGTMTTIAVFFPLLFLSGIIGQFIAGIPYTVILVLLSSLFVSLAFITVFCASFLKNRDAVQTATPKRSEQYLSGIKKAYRKLLEYLLNNAVPRRWFELGITALFVVSIVLVATGVVKSEFFPGGDIEFAYVAVEMSPGTSLGDTFDYAKQVEKVLQTKDYIESFVTTVGETSPFSNEVTVGEHYANITLNITREFQSEGPPLIDGLRRDIEAERLFNAEAVVASGGPPTGAPIDLKLNGEDTKQLRDVARRVEQLVIETPGTVTTETSLAGNTSGFEIVVDRNALHRYGVSLGAIASAIRGATDGVELFDITENGEDVPVFIRNRINYSSDETIVTKDVTPDMIGSLRVANNVGEFILLGSMIDIRLAEADSEIAHRDGERVVSITSDLEDGFNAVETRAKLEEKIKEMLPSGVTYSFGGEAQEQDESNAEMGIALLAGMFLVFTVLILQFGRWRQCLIIMSVIPYALAGVIFGLWFSSNALSFPAMLGFIALSGIVVNNSIILVSVFNQIKKDNPDWTVEEVVIEGSLSRLRPIILTSVTTIIGISPLLAASAIWAPIGYAIIFGLSFCVFVTLALIPLIYRRLEGFQHAPWATVGSWWLTMSLVFLLPMVIVAVAFSALRAITGEAAIALMIAIVVGALAMYTFTHTRKHK